MTQETGRKIEETEWRNVMKTVHVVAAVIRKDDKIFATQRGYDMPLVK